MTGQTFRLARRAVVAMVVSAVTITVGSAGATTFELDSSFSLDGRLRIPVLGAADVHDVEVDGEYVYAAGGGRTLSGHRVLFVMRTLSDGSLDPSFGDGGIVVSDERDACAVDSHDFILLGDGSSLTSCQSDSMLQIYRWTVDGRLDTSFSGDGFRRFALSSTESPDTAVVVEPSGRVLVGGMKDARDGTTIVVFRLMPNGVLDTTFASDGTRRLDIVDTDTLDDLALDSHNRLLVALHGRKTGQKAGSSERTPGRLVRLTHRGTYDESFSDDAIVQVNLRSFAIPFSYPIEIGVDKDDVVTVAVTSIGNAYGVVRVLADGARDFSYGVAGVLGVTCECFLYNAQVTGGGVVFAGSYQREGDLVATVGPTGTTIEQGTVNVYPASGSDYFDAVAAAGPSLLVGGSVGPDGFVALLTTRPD